MAHTVHAQLTHAVCADDQVKNRPLLVMSWLGKYISEAEYEKKLQGGEVSEGKSLYQPYDVLPPYSCAPP